MQLYRFKRGGVTPLHRRHEGKTLSSGASIERMPAPEKVCISMVQGAGAPAKPVVKPSDLVTVGQLIAEPAGFIGTRIHASVSGVVKGIVEMPTVAGGVAPHIVIENDGQDTGYDFPETGRRLTGPEILSAIQEAGLAGMGGAGFPTHVKMTIPEGKRCELLLINGAECEPFLTADQRLMEEDPDRILRGAGYAMEALGVKEARVGIENNKPAAIAAMEKSAQGFADVSICPMRTRYPQGSEKQLIQALARREVPQGGLPIDCGVVVLNVGTCAAIADAVERNKPLIERVVTVTGAVGRPSNLLCRIGTSFADAVAYCGGYGDHIEKLISGGPMMGFAQFTDEVTVGKGTSGILALDHDHAKQFEEWPCTHCGKCVQVCPVGLMPLMIDAYSRAGKMDMADEYNAMDCMECGCCSYICPSRRHLTQSIRAAKREILAARNAKKGGK